MVLGIPGSIPKAHQRQFLSACIQCRTIVNTCLSLSCQEEARSLSSLESITLEAATDNHSLLGCVYWTYFHEDIADVTTIRELPLHPAVAGRHCPHGIRTWASWRSGSIFRLFLPNNFLFLLIWTGLAFIFAYLASGPGGLLAYQNTAPFLPTDAPYVTHLLSISPPCGLSPHLLSITHMLSISPPCCLSPHLLSIAYRGP
jgi:hypothetical protein